MNGQTAKRISESLKHNKKKKKETRRFFGCILGFRFRFSFRFRYQAFIRQPNWHSTTNAYRKKRGAKFIHFNDRQMATIDRSEVDFVVVCHSRHYCTYPPFPLYTPWLFQYSWVCNRRAPSCSVHQNGQPNRRQAPIPSYSRINFGQFIYLFRQANGG